MADYTIRVYKNRDYNAVRMLFAEGTLEHIPATCAYLLKLPRAQFILFISFITLLLISRSYLLSLVSLAILFTAGRRLLKNEYHQYVDKCQREDLLDIEESYLASNNSCFWVVESNGRVIGMVGVQPVPRSTEVMVLRWLSVAKDKRHQGIAKALCQKVIDFTCTRGFKVLTMETSMIQVPAQKLYEKLGFQKTDVKIFPSLIGRFSNFTILTYEYRIKD
ncbi:probable N-acetyltransferase camello [Bufo gargarizans]|uniref:probable N-acetyltransferase camello n=1 Tax=Bufo gargarizans TaxID=30331 RepID=UPI001CF48806|nr:probable N-acetyltransferase camello [Bufo gargarizans]XP_044145165.1 probable N-acetyltransferase camello [Bufo gargarizans]